SDESAVAAATELIEEDGVDLILGPLLADSVRAVAPTARAAGVPLIAFSNDRAVASDGVYVLGFAPQEQVHRVMGFARARGFASFAALVPLSEYGQLMAQSTADSAAALGVAMADAAFYPNDPGDTTGRTEEVRALADYERRQKALEDQRHELAARDDEISRRTLKRLEIIDTLGDVGFDALVLPVGGTAVRELAPLLAFFDVDPARVKLLGTWLWDDPTLGREPTLVGAWFAAPPPVVRESFVARFESVYARAPSRLATLGYDAVALAAVLAGRAEAEQADAAESANAAAPPAAAPAVSKPPAPPPGSPYTVEALTSPNGFAGMDGIFRLMPDGRTERGLAVLEIRPDGLVTVDPAPQSFEAIVN
ncbi:MAG: penicillin-binding protein activator, partial [Alphaproteobacteria bacterium]